MLLKPPGEWVQMWFSVSAQRFWCNPWVLWRPSCCVFLLPVTIINAHYQVVIIGVSKAPVVAQHFTYWRYNRGATYSPRKTNYSTFVLLRYCWPNGLVYAVYMAHRLLT